MKIILRADLAGLGKRGDICDVADGYARNYLLPKSLALVATDGAVSQAKAMRRARDLKDAADKASAQTIASALVSKTIELKSKAGSEGRLFGSVTTAEIAAAVLEQTGAALDKRQIHLNEPIKRIGIHSVSVRLHSDVVFPISVEVSSK